jgi:hypothetical protein
MSAAASVSPLLQVGPSGEIPRGNSVPAKLPDLQSTEAERSDRNRERRARLAGLLWVGTAPLGQAVPGPSGAA